MSNDKKETAVDYLIKNIEIALKLNGVKLNYMYRMKTVYPHYSQAKAMEEKQITKAFNEGMECFSNDPTIQVYQGEQYYNETYGDDK